MDMETIMAQIKGHDPDFNREDKTKVYKEIVYYFKPAMNEKEEKEYDALNLETYIILTERYIYCVDLDNLEWLFDPIPISNIATVQLSVKNAEVCVFKRRVKAKTARACPFVILENKRMEHLIRFVKRTCSGLVTTEYKDVFHYTSDSGENKAFNLQSMSVFKPTDMDIRFGDANMHGWLEKMTMGWRALFSKNAKLQWVRNYYVLRNDTLYVFDKDDFESPLDTYQLDMFTLQPGRPAKYGGKEWVLELTRPEENPICFACEGKDKYERWMGKMQEAIDEAMLGGA